MKITAKLPVMIVLAGIVLVSVGAWQIADSSIQSNMSLKKAKELVDQQTANPTNNEFTTPAIGDTIGILEIPKIKAELPIVEGTNPDDLKKGVGHYKGSSLPGGQGEIVLSGHRDTVFRRLGQLSIGDSLIVRIPNESRTYKITHTKIVGANDNSIITLQKKEEKLILTTCYPFYYIGNAPKRYIVYASPI